MTCDFTGCKRQAVWAARKLFGDGGTLHTCDCHRPGGRPSANPAVRALVERRPFYDVKPLAGAK